MQNILKLYYNIPIELNHLGYFQYQNKQYYICFIKNTLTFYDIYHYYRYLMQLCHLSGYTIIANNQNQWFSDNYVLLEYIPDIFSYSTYLEYFLKPLPLAKITVSDIKERWINKMDCIFEGMNTYDDQQKPLIYYYLAMAENSINILNFLLQIDSHASLPLCLSLVSPIDNDVKELLNPCYYMISTRIRHLLILMHSDMLLVKQLENIFNNQFYDVYEIIYIYAHSLYPGYFFEQVLAKRDILKFYHDITKEKQFIKNLYQVLSLYVALPKIHWINDENML